MVSGLYTTVKNVSGAARTFGFLGPRGKRLEDDATYTVPGDLVADLGRGGRGSQRKFKALQAALVNGDIEIISPAVYMADEAGDPKQLTIDESGLVLGTPDGWD